MSKHSVKCRDGYCWFNTSRCISTFRIHFVDFKYIIIFILYYTTRDLGLDAGSYRKNRGGLLGKCHFFVSITKTWLGINIKFELLQNVFIFSFLEEYIICTLISVYYPGLNNHYNIIPVCLIKYLVVFFILFFITIFCSRW